WPLFLGRQNTHFSVLSIKNAEKSGGKPGRLSRCSSVKRRKLNQPFSPRRR
ncbi:hypothetical protein L9F63_022243, partial [Diploptera punctata]